MLGRRTTVVLMTCVAVSAMSLVLAAEDKWIEVKSAHFVVVSNDGQSSARTLAWQLEQIRGAVATLWPWAQVDPNRPLTVIAVRDEAGMKALVPGYWEKRGGVRPASVWMAGPDQYYLAIRTDQQIEETLTVNPHLTAYFAYVSLVLRQSVQRELPLWVSRGLAEVLSNTIVRNNDLLLGPPIPWHVEQLRDGMRWQVPALLRVTAATPQFRTDDGMGRFDSQAWAFVHFLMFGDGGIRAAKLDQFARMVASGTDPDTAFLESLGRPEDFQLPLATYVNRPVFSYKRIAVDVSVKRESFPVRPLPASEAASLRALFHAAMNRPVEARAAIAEAQKGGAAPDSFLAEALLLDRDGKKDEAIAAYTKAVDGGTKKPYAYYRLAALLWSPTPDRDTLARLDKLMAMAISLNNRDARAFAFFAEIRSLLGSDAAIAMARRGISLEPSEPSHRMTAARILWRQEKYDDALKEAQDAVAVATDDDGKRAARQLVDSIQLAQSRTLARTARTAPPPPATPPVPAAHSSSAPERESVERPDFRTLQPGEDRVEGTLVRIECATTGAVVFHLQSASGPVRASAARMTAVDFISYRETLGGSIGCGPLKEPLPVYLTWRTATGAPAAKVVVAIEFLPVNR